MQITNLFRTNIYAIYNSTLFEFLIIFTFFMSLLFVIFKQRFGDHRSAAGLSASISLALSIGLTSWMSRKGYTMQNLGTVSLIIIVAFAAAVTYKLIKSSGHGGIAILTIFLLIMPALSRSYWLIDYQAIFDMALTGWLLLLILILMKNAGPRRNLNLSSLGNKNYACAEADYADDQIKRMYRYRSLSNRISGQLRKLRKPSELLGDKNGQSKNLLLQLQHVLPEQGFLVSRMAELRKTAHLICNGHIAKIKETKKLCHRIPTLQKRKISMLLIEHYRNESDFEKRLERLESLVTAAEKQNRDLIAHAKVCVKTNNYQQYDRIIQKAKKLQDHITYIIKIIIRTEKKLSKAAYEIARDNINLAKNE